MTTKLHADYFRANGVKGSASRNGNDTPYSSRIGEPADELHYNELLTRIERLDESFDTRYDDMADDHADLQTACDFAAIEGVAANDSWY